MHFNLPIVDTPLTEACGQWPPTHVHTSYCEQLIDVHLCNGNRRQIRYSDASTFEFFAMSCVAENCAFSIDNTL